MVRPRPFPAGLWGGAAYTGSRTRSKAAPDVGVLVFIVRLNADIMMAG